MLALGFGGAGSLPWTVAAQGVLGGRPAALPAGQSIFRLSGSVSVNGVSATLQTTIRAGDTVETGEDGEIIFVIGDQSMLLRGNSRLVTEAESAGLTAQLLTGLRLLTGRILSVSRGSRMRIVTSSATIGIRGTGWYAESDPEQTYFCTCYGVADIGANNDVQSNETVAASHHDRPLYILPGAEAGRSIRDAPFINHTDQELALIESLVGREPPFIFPREDYTGPRREY